MTRAGLPLALVLFAESVSTTPNQLALPPIHARLPANINALPEVVS